MLVLYLIGAALLSVSPAFGSGLPVSARLLSGDELLRIGGIHDVQNHFAEALTYYDQALDVFRAHKQRKKEAIALTKIASIYERQGRRPEAAVQIRSALTLFSKAPDSPVHGDALFLSARLSLWLGARDDAAALLEQAQERYRQLKHVQALGSVTLQAGLLTIADASSDDGFREIQQVLDDARARRDDEQTLAALVALGDGNWILDRTDAAYTKYEEALALLEQRPQAAIETRVRIRIAGLSRIIGREEQGIASAKRAITLSQSLRDVSTEAAAWTLLGSLHEALGHGPESEEAFRRALAMYRQQKVFVHAVRPTLPPSATSPMGSRSPARP